MPGPFRRRPHTVTQHTDAVARVSAADACWQLTGSELEDTNSASYAAAVRRHFHKLVILILIWDKRSWAPFTGFTTADPISRDHLPKVRALQLHFAAVVLSFVVSSFVFRVVVSNLRIMSDDL